MGIGPRYCIMRSELLVLCLRCSPSARTDLASVKNRVMARKSTFLGGYFKIILQRRVFVVGF